MIELLAPAGSREALTAAVESGADAVYLAGNMFGARAYAANFDEAGMREAIRFAHLRGVRVHVAVNTIVDNHELPDLQKYLRFIYESGADAVLVQDLGVARIVRETAPRLPMHASTQMTVHNLDGVRALEALGFARVVLSREVTLEAVRHICANAKAEIEVFVHGALCVCYSGQCLMSSMIGGRSGNRGRCAQPCRLPYTLVDEKGNDLLGGSAGKYLLSPRDLNTIELLPRLLDAGVSSLKIEGRMKRPEYVAVAVGCYRRAVDSYLAGSFHVPAEDSRALAQIFNRDFTTAYLEKKQGRGMMSDKRPNNRGLMLGRVQEYQRLSDEGGRVAVRLTADLREGDQVDFWVKAGGRVTAAVQDMLPAEKASAGDTVSFMIKGRVFAGDRVFKVYDAAIMEAARAMYNTGAPVRRVGVRAAVSAAVGQPLRIVMEDENGSRAEAATDFVGQEAVKHPLTREAVARQISRLGSSIFALKDPAGDLSVAISGNVMVPVSEINEARRRCVEGLEAARLAAFDMEAARLGEAAAAAVKAGVAISVSEPAFVKSRRKNTAGREKTGITVVADDLERLSAALDGGADRVVFGGESYSHQAITLPMYSMAVKLAHTAGAAVVFNTPRIIRESGLPDFHKWLSEVKEYGADGINVHNIGALYAVRSMTGLAVETDYSLISYNLEALKQLGELGVSRAVLSPELNLAQAAALAAESPLPTECIADGHIELMVSEYCCTGSFLGRLDTGSCGAPCGSGRKFFLKDRKDISFPLVMDQYCHMHLLNGSRLSMLPHAGKFPAMGVSALRIDGRYMDAGRLKKIVRNYKKYMSYPAEPAAGEENRLRQLEGENITRGHYFRGVL